MTYIQIYVDAVTPIRYPLHHTHPHQHNSFSQGSAQAFAAFTMDHGKLAQKVKLFVALSAPPRAKGLNASYLSALVESNPRFIYLLFGRHAMLPSTLMWMKVGGHDAWVGRSFMGHT